MGELGTVRIGDPSLIFFLFSFNCLLIALFPGFLEHRLDSLYCFVVSNYSSFIVCAGVGCLTTLKIMASTAHVSDVLSLYVLLPLSINIRRFRIASLNVLY